MSMATIVSSSTTRMRTSAMRPPVTWKDDAEFGAIPGRDLHRPFDLLDQAAHQAEAQRVGPFGLQALGQPAAIVPDRELADVGRRQGQTYVNGAAAGRAEGVLEGVGEELVHDQPARHRHVDVEVDLGSL